MSTRYDDVGTPCPTAWRRDSKLPFRNSTYISDFYDEFGLCEGDTAPIDFTADVRTPLTKVKPRKGGQAKAFSIHEDGLDNFGPVKGKPTEPGLRPNVKPICKSSSMFSQPAQRFQRPRVSFAALEAPKAEEPAVQRKSPPQPNKSPIISNRITTQKEEQPPVIAADPLKKSIRRRTIYIPSEDTTVPSVFMGIFSPIKNVNPLKRNDDVTEASEIGSLESKIIRKRSARKSLSVAPRRAPLQPTLKPMQESSIKQDIPGQNGGKENMPPGGVTISSTKHGKLKGEDFPVFDVPHVEKRKSAGAVEPVKRAPSIVKSAVEAKPETRSNPPPANRKPLGNKPSVTLNSKISLRGKNTFNPKTNVKAVPSQGSRPPRSSPVPKLSARGKPAVTQRAPTKLTGPKTLQLRIDQKYPLLSEDISYPAMYEENWLAHQEAAITQLVNGLFDSARGNTGLYNSDTLRHELLGIYQGAPFSLLYKRIHASLLYGSLGVPRDVLARGNGLKEDIGRKRTFLNFWIETYDLSALRAAAETVIGRRIPVPSRPSRLSDSKTSVFPREGRHLRRTLESFLETFILRNEDVGPTIASLDGEDVGTPRWSYRRTILRSIMIIVLLDKARSNSGTTLPRCLFNPSSKYKSSAAALQGLGAMLLPSVGDITRLLSHLDCRVSYKQHPLQEYDYRINNLAVDLRDGILLTRLVELLLYPSASAVLSQEHGPDATSTALAMPTGEILPLVEGEEDWILSQHLKIPCIGRATKLFNVQIALGALAVVRGFGSIAQEIRAEDIVDGNREKTIALLWGLVGKWGLSVLVDWDDVRREIRRLEMKAATCGAGSGSRRESEASSEEVEEEEEEEEKEEADFDACYERHSFLLKKWASCLARLGGVRLDNLTTSFADGRIFGSIVDEYEGFIVGEEGKLNSSTSLDVRLRFLGCSRQFGKSDDASFIPSFFENVWIS